MEDERGGLVPEGEGWFVLNAKDARWLSGSFGAYCPWEGKNEAKFPQLGINLNVLEPGVPMAMYHRENEQEDFLVLAGECLAVVEGEERPLRPWDLLHCPAGTSHVVIGAGTGPALVLAVGGRADAEESGLVYPADPTAQELGAGVAEETKDPAVAYEGMQHEWGTYKEGWLP